MNAKTLLNYKQENSFFKWLLIILLAIPLSYGFIPNLKVTKNVEQVNFRVVAYFRGDIKEVEKYDYNKITHLIYCFMYLQGNKLCFK